MSEKTETSQLIAEYERLRERSTQLFQEWNEIDERMVEIERQLPDSYTFPGDRPLNPRGRRRVARKRRGSDEG